MTVKLAILKSGEQIIADIKEGIVEDKIVTYIFNNPCKVVLQGSYKVISDDEESMDKMSISIGYWPTLSADKVVSVITDFVVTIVEPNFELKKMYEEQVLNNGTKTNQSNSIDESTDSN